MRIFNHLLGVVLLAVLLAAALVTLGLVLGVLTLTMVRQVWPYAPIETIGRDVANLPDATRNWVIGGSIGAAVVTLLGLIRELSPPPRRARLLTLQGSGPGQTEISFGALDDLAAYGARKVAGIEHLHARVDMVKGRLVVRGRALVSPYVELATAGQQLEQAVANRLEQATGLPVLTVQLRTVVQNVKAQRTVR